MQQVINSATIVDAVRSNLLTNVRVMDTVELAIENVIGANPATQRALHGKCNNAQIDLQVAIKSIDELLKEIGYAKEEYEAQMDAPFDHFFSFDENGKAHEISEEEYRRITPDDTPDPIFGEVSSL